jgi:hypothetical protein
MGLRLRLVSSSRVTSPELPKRSIRFGFRGRLFSDSAGRVQSGCDGRLRLRWPPERWVEAAGDTGGWTAP